MDAEMLARYGPDYAKAKFACAVVLGMVLNRAAEYERAHEVADAQR